ncbi:MAG: hypothetical protein AAGH19_08460 [Pseudomonadota bacterium]
MATTRIRAASNRRSGMIRFLGALLLFLPAALAFAQSVPPLNPGPPWDPRRENVTWEIVEGFESPGIQGWRVSRPNAKTLVLDESFPEGWRVTLIGDSPFEAFPAFGSDNDSYQLTVRVDYPGGSCEVSPGDEPRERAQLFIAPVGGDQLAGSFTMTVDCLDSPDGVVIGGSFQGPAANGPSPLAEPVSVEQVSGTYFNAGRDGEGCQRTPKA